MRLRRFTIATLTILAGGGCGGASARDQWTIRVTTDAPVPQLVSRALIEILDDTGALACPDCGRQVALPSDPSAWPISFGVVKPGSGKPTQVRVRFYRASQSAEDGIPLPATAIDALASLPQPSGDTVVGLVMHADCVGVPSDLDARATCTGVDRSLVPAPTLALGDPDSATRPGTWPPATPSPCTDAPDGMACVPGGFFVLGDAASLSLNTTTNTGTTDERFVTVSPFAMDREEMTVGVVRALVQTRKVSGEPALPVDAAADAHNLCTYRGPDDATNDALPVSCVTHAFATAVCAALGKRLPTEAEWEWAAGNLTDESRYPWEDVTASTCDQADVGLGRDALASPIDEGVEESATCRFRPGLAPLAPGLPSQPKSGDRTALGIVRLAGGLSEWVEDYAASYVAPCWHPEIPFLVDPHCDSSATKVHVLRGRAWDDAPGLVTSVGRQAIAVGAALEDSQYNGFRCVLPRGGDTP